MTPKELALQSAVPLWKVYYVASRLGRLPTVDELVNWKPKRGRPTKNWETAEEYKNAFDDMFAESNSLLDKLTSKKEN
jgi:sugar-specific transcriptional regulator TrmB